MASNDQAVRKPADFQAQVAQQQAQVRANVATKNAARTAAAQPSVTPEEAASFNKQSGGRFSQATGISDGLLNSNASTGEFATAQARAAQAGPRTGQFIPPEQLTRAETNSFNAQSQGRFSAVNPVSQPASMMSEGTGAGPNVSVAAPRGPLPGIGAGLGDAAPAATSRLAQVGEAAGRAMVRARPVTRVLGRAGALMGVANEGVDVARVARDPNASKLDVAEQAAEGTGKLATAYVGAEGGAALGSFLGPVGTVVGGIGGGLAGYFGGEKLIHKLRGGLGGDEASPAELSRQRAEAAQTTPAAAGGLPMRDDLGLGDSSLPTLKPSVNDDPARKTRQQDNGGITPVADRTGDPGEVLGTFNGRQITRADSDRLAGNQSLGGTATVPSVGDGLAPAPQGGAPGANFNGSGSEDRVRAINDPNSAAGKLYAQLSADKTPTGKRVAAQFLDGFVNAGTQELGQRRSLAGDELAAQTQVQRGREGDAASLRDTQLRTRAAAKSSPQYVFNPDGTIDQISAGVLSAVNGPDGKPAKASKGQLSAMDREKMISERLQQVDPGNVMTPDERKAERANVLKELAASVGAGLDGQ